MINFNKFLAFLLFLVFPFLQSCDSEDDQVPTGEFAQGVIILNEGNFAGSDASISFFNSATQQVEQDVFRRVNGRGVGSVLQSIYFHDEKGYLVVNNSNKVEIIDSETFVSSGVLEEDLANPRYMAAMGNKGYITNWGTFNESFQLDQSYIAVVDLSSVTVTKKINTEDGTEGIIIANNKAFATNSFTNTVSVIDLASETVVATIELASSPTGIVKDKDGMIWVICSGNFGGNDAHIFSINPNTNAVIKEIPLSINTAGRLLLNSEADKLFFTSGKSVFELPISANSAPASPLFTVENLVGGIYGLGIEPGTNNIYAGDAVAFQGNGRVYRFQPDGTAIDNFNAGIGPNGFWFR